MAFNLLKRGEMQTGLNRCTDSTSWADPCPRASSVQVRGMNGHDDTTTPTFVFLCSSSPQLVSCRCNAILIMLLIFDFFKKGLECDADRCKRLVTPKPTPESHDHGLHCHSMGQGRPPTHHDYTERTNHHCTTNHAQRRTALRFNPTSEPAVTPYLSLRRVRGPRIFPSTSNSKARPTLHPLAKLTLFGCKSHNYDHCPAALESVAVTRIVLLIEPSSAPQTRLRAWTSWIWTAHLVLDPRAGSE